MNIHTKTHESDSVQAFFGIDLDMLLAPISDQQPSGEYLRFNNLYREISEARKQDDASLPLGVWNRELKKADWSQVSLLTLSALTTKTKDIQLMVWLLEAEIHLKGFTAIAPVMGLLTQLCLEFWPSIHPQVDDALESRLNPISWIDEKLLPLLRLTPITRCEGGREYGYADFMTARRNETLKKDDRNNLPKDALITAAIERAVSATPVEFYLQLHGDLASALDGTHELCSALDQLCGGKAPSLSAFSEVLGEILDLVRAELSRRGYEPRAASDEMDAEALQDMEMIDGVPSRQRFADNGSIDRKQIYHQMEAMARCLMEMDPHSPAPYLVLQACRWGEMTTRELYQELFVNRQGQMHIFDLLGVSRGKPGGEQPANA